MVRCHHCDAAIDARADLRVGGRGLLPFHAACYHAYATTQPWYRKPGWPLNRWRSFVPFNALLVGVVLAVHLLVEPVQRERWPGLVGLLLLANGWLLGARAVSWWTHERHLPRSRTSRAAASPPAA